MEMEIHHWATVLFAAAILHTFAAARFRLWAHLYPKGSLRHNVLELLGETEVIMLMWASLLFVDISVMEGIHHTSLITGITEGFHRAIDYVESLDFKEPKFVVVIMTICATKPVVHFVDGLIRSWATVLRKVGSMSESAAFLLSAMTLGPLLGSFITEPAAMTVTALVLKRQFFERGISRTFKYAILGNLFVAVSIGGVLTHFAAPPVLMVAHKWGWGLTHMLHNFGWKAVMAVCVNAVGLVFFFRRELGGFPLLADSDRHGAAAAEMRMPVWVVVVHLAALGFTVATSHHPDVFLGGFMIFLGFVTVTKEFQEPLQIRQALLVGGFLAGLVTLGGLQEWWLAPLLASLGEFPLFAGAIGLTAVTDNAALTYLGTQVEGLSSSMRYALVAGAVAGGGLTVIANAPNPAGYQILNPTFENGGSKGGISPLGLLVAAVPPTLVAAACFWFLPSL